MTNSIMWWWTALVLLSWFHWTGANGWQQPQDPVAFAGGFGSSSNTKKSQKRKKKKRALSELQQAPPKKPKEPKQEEVQLDKWGLPVATQDDIFPPIPAGTELLPVPDEHTTTLADIQEALRDYQTLNFEMVDENGVEKNPHENREPMKLRLLHQSPPVLAIENFFTKEECEQTRQLVEIGKQNDSSELLQVESAMFSPLATSKRTSTTWFCHYAQMPTLLAKAGALLLNVELEQMEEPQIVRYKTGQEFTWHYDEVPAPQLSNGGQRVATLLVYLNTVQKGGGTIFRDLQQSNQEQQQQLTMSPKQGSALLFFPANAKGVPDDRTLHKGEVVQEEKWITQMWIHQDKYKPVVPDGNSHDAAKSIVEETRQTLGYAE